MERPKYHIRTFGCQMNVADSNLFEEHLGKRGYSSTDDIKKANVILVNTCTVRHHAENRALSFIGFLKKLKIKNDKLKIIVAGCVAERIGEKQIKHKFPYVDLVFGAKNVLKFPELFDELERTVHIKHSPSPCPSPIEEEDKKEVGTVSQFVTIIRGCNNFCSYCIVPYVRGKEKSMPVKNIIDEIKGLVKQGVKEVTLLGQNVNSYKSKTTDFAGLLDKVNEVDGLERIRFMTNHPKDMNDRIIDAIASNEKVCEHVHLPLQSGSDTILKLMNRKYNMKIYYSIIEKLRSKIPGICITTDILLGFPHETEKDFKKTLEAIKKIGFDFAYVFKYSPREKTKASRWEDTVPQEDKSRRHAIALDLCNSISNEKNRKFPGKVVEVLVDSGSEDGKLSGKTRDNRSVVFTAVKSLKSPFINVRITGSRIHSLEGIASDNVN